MEEGNFSLALEVIKKNIIENQELFGIFSYLYTNILGCNRIKGKRHNTVILKNCLVKKCNINIKGQNNKILIRDHCLINKCNINIVGNNNTILVDQRVSAVKCEIHIEDNDNLASIGKGTHICGQTHLACIEGSKILIGENCLFSSEITFRTGDSHSILDFDGKRINPSKSIVIGTHVWIGNKTIITKGVKIADNSIVATGSVVTKQFKQSNIIIGGNPAKIIKKDIKWDERRI